MANSNERAVRRAIGFTLVSLAGTMVSSVAAATCPQEYTSAFVDGAYVCLASVAAFGLNGLRYFANQTQDKTQKVLRRTN
jgi:uncharacterized protein (DUF697 family)